MSAAFSDTGRRRLVVTQKHFVFLCFLTLGFTESIGSLKLSYANVAQLGLVLMCIPLVRFRQVDLLLLVLVIASMLLAAMNALANGITPRWAVIAFVTFSLPLGMAVNRVMSTREGMEMTADAARAAIRLLVPIYVLLALYHYQTVGLIGMSFGADDKSHAAIYMAFLAFASIFAFQRSGAIIGASLLLLSCLTISRLPFAFLPFFGLAVLLHALSGQTSKRTRRRIWLSGLLAVVGFGYVMVNYSDAFLSLERISAMVSGDRQPSASTIAHRELIRLGWEIKMQSLGNFIFGVSPGAFAETLLVSGLDYNLLAAVDPKFIAAAMTASAPIHSTHMAILAEYPIWIFGVFAWVSFTIAYRLLQTRQWVWLLFFIPFNVATLYYSANNKPYWFLVMGAMVAIAYSKPRHIR